MAFGALTDWCSPRNCRGPPMGAYSARRKHHVRLGAGRCWRQRDRLQRRFIGVQVPACIWTRTGRRFRQQSGKGGCVLDGRFALPTGTVLDGAYRIVRVVGTGGFGITYEAEDIALRHHGGAQGILPRRVRRPRRAHERAAQVRAPQADLRMGTLQLPQGGAYAGALRASQHRARQPRVRGPLDRLHGDELRAGPKPRGLAQGPRPAADAGRARSHSRAPARRAAADARRRLPASRHRPRQHHRARRRQPGAARFRRLTPCGRRDEPRHDRHRQGRLLPARAVRQRRPPAGALVGSLRARRHALPRRHRVCPRGSHPACRRGPHGPGHAGCAGQLSAGLPGRHRRLPQGPARGPAALGRAAAADAVCARAASSRASRAGRQARENAEQAAPVLPRRRARRRAPGKTLGWRGRRAAGGRRRRLRRLRVHALAAEPAASPCRGDAQGERRSPAGRPGRAAAAPARSRSSAKASRAGGGQATPRDRRGGGAGRSRQATPGSRARRRRGRGAPQGGGAPAHRFARGPGPQGTAAPARLERASAAAGPAPQAEGKGRQPAERRPEGLARHQHGAPRAAASPSARSRQCRRRSGPGCHGRQSRGAERDPAWAMSSSA